MAELNDLSTLAASNTGRFPNGMQVEQINDAARELEAMIARDFKDRTLQLATAGTGAAYTLTSNRTLTTLGPGLVMLIRAHVANTGSATLAVNGMSAKPLCRQNGDPLQVGDIALNQALLVVYNPALDRWTCFGIAGASVSASDMPRVLKTALPPVSDQRAIVVTDEAGGAVMAFSDGTNWRRVTDRAIVS